MADDDEVYWGEERQVSPQVTKRQHLASRARPVAEQIMGHLRPACWRIEIAGSLRREKPTVGDIEIVCVPRMGVDLFGQPTSACMVTSVLDQLLIERRLRWRRHDAASREAFLPGEKPLRAYFLVAHRTGIPVDIFAVRPPAEWGAIFAIRTGPAAFSQSLVVSARRQGLRCERGRLVDPMRNTEVHTPEERDFFRACGVQWLEPKERAT